MPQEFQVVQCYNCHVYQVDIVKKVSRWICKICNAKQSVIKVYCKGTGKYCRLHVQELNEKRITMDNIICEPETSTHVLENENQEYKMQVDNRQNNKWVQFMENNKTVEEETTCESFIETQLASCVDNMVSRVTRNDDQIAYESHLETEIQYGTATTQQNTSGLYLENQIQRQELNVDNMHNSKWSKFMEKYETSGEQIAYESLLEIGGAKQNVYIGSKENDKDQVHDFTSDWETKQVAAADETIDRTENVECIIFHHLGERDAANALEKKYASVRHNTKLNQTIIKNDSCVQKKEDCVSKDVNAIDNKLFIGGVQCPLKRAKSKVVEIDKKDINSKRKKFSDKKNIFDCDRQHNIESLFDI